MHAHITEQQRRQYLHAMGIEPLIRRGISTGATAAGTATHYQIGPGAGGTLLLCDGREQAASALASDIARCLVEVPIWGWCVDPGPGDARTPAFTLESAIEERLFTRVLLFSDIAPAQADVIGSARIIRAPSLQQLANNPQAKRALWSQLVEHGWAGRRG